MGSNNGTSKPPSTVRDTFRWCLSHGFNPLPGVHGTKQTVHDGNGVYKQQARNEYLDKWFPQDQPRNIGVVNGELSGNLLDVDLDSREAVLAAPLLLPATAWRFRRHGADNSAHRLYRTEAPFPEPFRKYGDLDGSTLLELRGTGHWSIWPPSIHPSGAPIEWESTDEDGPPRLLLADLVRAGQRLAAAVLIARHWPGKGNRNEASMALAGGLARMGWPLEEREVFAEAVALAAGDEEMRARVRNVASTARKSEAGEKVTGWIRLMKLLGEAVVRQAWGWLGAADRKTATGSSSTGKTPIEWPDPIPLGCDPTVPPFPVQDLPLALVDWTRCVSEATQTPLDLPGLLALGVCAPPWPGASACRSATAGKSR